MDENAAPLLSVKKIYKSFGSNAVLKGVDLNVYRETCLPLSEVMAPVKARW